MIRALFQGRFAEWFAVGSVWKAVETSYFWRGDTRMFRARLRDQFGAETAVEMLALTQ